MLNTIKPHVTLTNTGILLLAGGSLLINVENYQGLANGTRLSMMICGALAIGIEVSKLLVFVKVREIDSPLGKFSLLVLGVLLVAVSIASLTLWFDKTFSVNARAANSITITEAIKAQLLNNSNQLGAIGHVTNSTNTLDKLIEFTESASTTDTKTNGIALPVKVGSVAYWIVLTVLSSLIDLGCISLILTNKKPEVKIEEVAMEEEVARQDCLVAPAGQEEPKTPKEEVEKVSVDTEVSDAILEGQHCDKGTKQLIGVATIGKAHKIGYPRVKAVLDQLMTSGQIVKNKSNRYELTNFPVLKAA